jgi:hypothetical protein
MMKLWRAPVSIGCSKHIALLFLLAVPVFAQEAKTTNTSFATVADLAKPARRIPFKDVIYATTQYRVLDFNTNNSTHVELESRLLKAAALAGEQAAKKGIAAARPNEAGNHLEPFVRNALREAGLEAHIPQNSNGDAQAAGYPDIAITGSTPCYLELKTYNAHTENTTQRSFYYSPSPHPKITRDALHFLLAYELRKETRDTQTVYIPIHWKLLTLENLQVDLKSEFNQSNRGLYGSGNGNAVLSEGAVR